MSTSTPETRELQLVQKVELRIALADSDAKLTSLLDTYLAPLLLKAGSDQSSVRDKTISIAQHIKIRAKPLSVKLPVAALLKQFRESSNNLIRHLDILFIRQGIDKLSNNEKWELFPSLLHSLRENYDSSPHHVSTLFNLVLRLLHSISIPIRGSEGDANLRVQLELVERTRDSDFVAHWLGKFFLFRHNESKHCPGLSDVEIDFFEPQGQKDIWNPLADGLNCTETKVAALKFLASGAFVDLERFMPALLASADPNSRISDPADDMLKRAISAISFDDPQVLEQLLKVYLGTPGSQKSSPTPVPLKIKILSLLARSKIPSSLVAQSIEIVQDGLVPSSSQAEDSSAPPTQGLEAAKFTGQLFTFINWLIQISSNDMRNFAPILLAWLRDYIKRQGWPRLRDQSSRSSMKDLDFRNLCYENIGRLASAFPGLLLEGDFELLRWLFSSLNVDSSGPNTSMSIEQALDSVLVTFPRSLNSRSEQELAKLLISYMKAYPGHENSFGAVVVRSARYMVVRFANRCLSYGNITARSINVLAMANSFGDGNEIREEGKKGLDPYWYRMTNPSIDNSEEYMKRYLFPEFSDLVLTLFGPGAEWNVQNFEGSQVHLNDSYEYGIIYCRSVLIHEALNFMHKAPLVNANWEQNNDALVANDEDSRAYIKSYLNQLFIINGRSRLALQTYLVASFYGLVDYQKGGSSRSGECLLELCQLGPSSLSEELTSKISLLKTLFFSSQRSVKITLPHVFGLVASQDFPLDASIKPILDLSEQKIQNWRTAVGVDILYVHNSILIISYFVSRAIYRGYEASELKEIKKRLMASVLDILTDSRDEALLDAAILAVSELSLYASVSLEADLLEHKFSMLLKRLKDLSRSGDERAILSLGYIAMQCKENEAENSRLQGIMAMLYEFHDLKEVETQFTVGASLTCAAVGWRSKSLTTISDFEVPPQTERRDKTLSELLNKVMTTCKTTKPAMRRASVIWLLCIVQYCGHLQAVRSHLRECQTAFKGFLGDRETLNQESASRGLSLVYEKGDSFLKDDLVRDLVDSFTDTRANLAGSVSDETELFDAGALSTGDGSITTYKDIMSLASEVGDPSLVYRFMSLASNNAIWSSRAAFGRFGLSDLLSNSSVDQYLTENPKLYAALFRYRFDPNPNVRNSMNEIWNAMVKEPTKIIDVQFDNIINDLLTNILNREWRVRQASCAAIADLIQGRSSKGYGKHLVQIWSKTFKVCDDIKNSVRSAALKLAQILTRILTRSLEASDSSSRTNNAILEQIIPFLLSPSGLESGVKEVQHSASNALLNIVKNSKERDLRPFLPKLISYLLTFLSSWEDGSVEYIRSNAERYNLNTEDIDDVRLRIIRDSPIMQAIERCLDFLDDQTMEALSPHLADTMKTAIGLPSKVGSARVLVALCTRKGFTFKSYADRFLKLAIRHLLDRNEAVASAFVAACGYLARLASDQEILKLFEHCQKLYLDSADDRHRLISGEVICAVSRYATDRFNSLASGILPFVFIAKHEIFERDKNVFERSWDENVGGRRAIFLYLNEIVTLASKHMDSPIWNIRRTSALAIADIIDSLGREIDDSIAKIVWPALEKAVGGKVWEGKEKVLQSFVRYAANSNALTSDESLAQQIESTILRECKRNNAIYRSHALACLGDFAEQAKDQNLFARVHDVVKPVIEDILSDSNQMDIDLPSGGTLSPAAVNEATLANAAGALLQSTNPRIQDSVQLTMNLTSTLELVTKVVSRRSDMTVLRAVYTHSKQLFGRIGVPDGGCISDSMADVLVRYVTLFNPPSDSNEQTRLHAAEALAAMIPVAHHHLHFRQILIQEVRRVRAQERSMEVQRLLDGALTSYEG